MRWLMIALVCAGCRLRFDEHATDAAASSDASGDGGCAPIPGLLVYYPMNAGDLMPGFVLADRSGNQRDATIMDDDTTPTISTMGHISESMDFRATPVGNFAYAEVALPLPANPGEAITISMWFYRESATSPDNDVLVDAPRNPRFDLWLNANRACINTANSDCWGIRDMTLFDRWVHIAAIMRNGIASDSEVFLDGVQQVNACINGATFPCATSRVLGNPVLLSSSDSSYTYRGFLDEVRIYDRALTPQQIAALALDTTCL